MTPTWRKPAGMALILLVIALWSIAVVSVVDATRLPTLVTMALYLLAGIAWLWVFPMRRLLFWMEHGRWGK